MDYRKFTGDILMLSYWLACVNKESLWAEFYDYSTGRGHCVSAACLEAVENIPRVEKFLNDNLDSFTEDCYKQKMCGRMSQGIFDTRDLLTGLVKRIPTPTPGDIPNESVYYAYFHNLRVISLAWLQAIKDKFGDETPGIDLDEAPGVSDVAVMSAETKEREKQARVEEFKKVLVEMDEYKRAVKDGRITSPFAWNGTLRELTEWLQSGVLPTREVQRMLQCRWSVADNVFVINGQTISGKKLRDTNAHIPK